ncbi:hypothetical protein KQI58_16360 [Enterococcus raffinosus]|jgi:hypothetical protein|uniref:hypothetical protein n=1 Tax=Enterococcus raffinosus TaxID=71452 RepID=UPI001C1060D4|nr:hypothetical protein [Enterococcus raffinosus]MBU5362647.1 hypothetical protein [Enterococcus raffinosus]
MNHEKTDRLSVPLLLYVFAAKYFRSVNSTVLVGTGNHGFYPDDRNHYVPDIQSQRMEVIE